MNLRIRSLGSVNEKVGVWIKAVRKAKFSKQAFLIDSAAELFINLYTSVIQCFRFGSRKVRLLNRALLICMDPHSLNKLHVIVTKYCFPILRDDTSFFFFISFFFVLMLCYVMLCYVMLFCYYKSVYKNYFITIIVILFSLFFHKNYFYFFMFRDVPACSGIFRVPGFIDAHQIQGNWGGRNFVTESSVNSLMIINDQVCSFFPCFCLCFCCWRSHWTLSCTSFACVYVASIN